MGTLSNYATTELVDHVFKAAYSPAATLYLALCTTTPTAASTGTTIVETDYTSYVRKSFTVTTFGAAGAVTARMIKQILDIEFAQATGDGSLSITGYAICDASTNGNMLCFGAFNSNFDVVTGNTPKIASGEIDISIGASGGAGFTDIAAELMLDLMFRNQAWSTPSAAIHFGATTATIADTDTLATITEATGGSYAREPVPASSFDDADAGVTINNTKITFDAPSGDWSTGSDITSLFVCNHLTDQTTASDLLAYDNSNVVDQPVGLGDTVNIQIGDFDCDLD